MRANELGAYGRLVSLYAAQERYRETDWDHDGVFTYALFLPHLWQTVDGEAKPVRVRLVPKRFAFAVSPSRAIDGYCFEDVHLPDRRSEWAIAARPAAAGRSGRLRFIATHPGGIRAKEGSERTRAIPDDSETWTPIPGEEALRRLQGAIER